MIKINKHFLPAICILLLFGCSSNHTKKETQANDELKTRLKKINRYVSKQTYFEDSLYFSKVIRENIDSGKYGAYQGYHYMFDRASYRDSIGIYIDEIFYSPDSLKVFAFVILNVPYKYEKESGIPQNDQKRLEYNKEHPWSLSVTTIIGFRNNYSTPWYLYHSWQREYVEYENYELIKGEISNYYWSYTKKRASKPQSKPKYNLDNPNFWNNELFRKDNKMVGFYDFQVSCYIKNVDERTCEFEVLLNGESGYAPKPDKFPPRITILP